jgi:hypothetical protein
MWQGLSALFAFAQPIDESPAESHLSPGQMALFKRLNRGERLHSLHVLRDVMAQEESTPHDLVVAALLHDVGKIRYSLAVWQKTLAVLLKRFAPSVYHRWSKESPSRSWRIACVVAEHHPAWGAELVAETGATECALWLIEHHADPITRWSDHPYGTLLHRLQQADNEN